MITGTNTGWVLTRKGERVTDLWRGRFDKRGFVQGGFLVIRRVYGLWVGRLGLVSAVCVRGLRGRETCRRGRSCRYYWTVGAESLVGCGNGAWLKCCEAAVAAGGLRSSIVRAAIIAPCSWSGGGEGRGGGEGLFKRRRGAGCRWRTRGK